MSKYVVSEFHVKLNPTEHLYDKFKQYGFWDNLDDAFEWVKTKYPNFELQYKTDDLCHIQKIDDSYNIEVIINSIEDWNNINQCIIIN